MERINNKQGRDNKRDRTGKGTRKEPGERKRKEPGESTRKMRSRRSEQRKARKSWKKEERVLEIHYRTLTTDIQNNIEQKTKENA